MKRVTLGGRIAVVSQFLASVAVGVLVEPVCVYFVAVSGVLI